MNDLTSGYGRLIHVSGDYYVGEWKLDKANGKGMYNHISGATYEGDWKNDKQHGLGTEIWPDKSKFTGAYVDGMK